MNRRLTGGLAWAGLLLVLAVPSADFISQQFGGSTALSVDPVQTPAPKKAPVAAAKPAKTPVAEVTPAAKKVKPMPSYISDGKADEGIDAIGVEKPVAAAKPTPARVIPGTAPAIASVEGPKVIISAPASKTPVTVPVPAEVATVAVDPTIAPPIPMPASMRPTQVASRPQTDMVNTGGITTVNQSGYEPDEIVTSEDLADWESGPLEEFLAKRRGAPRPQADVGTYDSDGFYLSDGPNGPQLVQRVYPVRSY